jgi:hypothetical protein
MTPNDAKGPDRPGLRKAGDADVHPSTPPLTTDDVPLLRVGATTADAIGMPDKDKLVDLDVQIPKSLRKSVRQEAKRRGISPDHVVAEALRQRPVH